MNSLRGIACALILVAIISAHCCSCISRVRRAAYDLPAGIEEQLGITVKKTFKCEAEGYFADVDNDCKLFHNCHSSGGRKFTQSSMACGINQVFDQSKLSCNYEDQAIPCPSSPEFFYLNERIGDPTADFLSEQDIDKARNARPDYKAKK